MSKHLCLSCRHAEWARRNGRLTGRGFCEVPNPEMPKLPAVKWWADTPWVKPLGGDIYRENKYPVLSCHFYEKGKR